MLPTPLTRFWSSSTRFTPEARRARASRNASSSKAGSSGSRAMCGDLRRDRLRAHGPVTPGGEAGDLAVGGRHEPVDGERAERALVDEVDAELAVLGMLEVQADARVTVVARMVGRSQQQLAAHAEVADDRALARRSATTGTCRGARRPRYGPRSASASKSPDAASCRVRARASSTSTAATRAPVTAGASPARTTSTSGSSGTSAAR